MHALLDRIKRERRWTLGLFLVAAAVIVLTQIYLVPRVPEPAAPRAAPENAG
jgi:hypothetical protein